MHNVMIVMGFHMVATEMMKKKFGGKKKIEGGGGVLRWVMDLLSQYRENGLEIAGPKR